MDIAWTVRIIVLRRVVPRGVQACNGDMVRVRRRNSYARALGRMQCRAREAAAARALSTAEGRGVRRTLSTWRPHAFAHRPLRSFNLVNLLEPVRAFASPTRPSQA